VGGGVAERVHSRDGLRVAQCATSRVSNACSHCLSSPWRVAAGHCTQCRTICSCNGRPFAPASALCACAYASPLAKRVRNTKPPPSTGGRTVAASLDLPLCHVNREGRRAAVRMERSTSALIRTSRRDFSS